MPNLRQTAVSTVHFQLGYSTSPLGPADCHYGRKLATACNCKSARVLKPASVPHGLPLAYIFDYCLAFSLLLPYTTIAMPDQPGQTATDDRPQRWNRSVLNPAVTLIEVRTLASKLGCTTAACTALLAVLRVPILGVAHRRLVNEVYVNFLIFALTVSPLLRAGFAVPGSDAKRKRTYPHQLPDDFFSPEHLGDILGMYGKFVRYRTDNMKGILSCLSKRDLRPHPPKPRTQRSMPKRR